MASDGMWDHMSLSKAVQLVRELDAEPAAAELVRYGGSVNAGVMCGEGARWWGQCWPLALGGLGPPSSNYNLPASPTPATGT